MRAFRHLIAIGAAAGLLLAPLAAAGSASAAVQGHVTPQTRLTGGHTTVTTAPGIATTLLGHGIVPIATLPGTEGVGSGSGGINVRFSFPVTGGQLNLSKLTGTIEHRGGILFLDLATGKQIAVSNFDINVQHATLTAIVNGNPQARVPLLRLSLAHAKVSASQHCARISGIVLRLTSAAAKALDATFSTTLFKAGLELGTASTTLRF